MRRSRERQSRERQSRERKNRERPGGKKYFLVPAVLLCAAVAILYGKSVLAEEKTGEHGMEQTDPAEPAETQVEIVCPAPDGNNGWYRSSPEVTIRQTGKDIFTEYMLETPSGKKIHGELGREPAESGEAETPEETDLVYTVTLDGGVWEDGENILSVRTVSSGDGQVLSGETRTILLDRTPPSEVSFSYPPSASEAGKYYSSEIRVRAVSGDEVSGVEKIIYALENGEGGEIPGASGEIPVRPGYKGKIRACAVNGAGAAGNVTISGQICCEDKAPEIRIETSGGFDIWHQETPKIKVFVKDSEEDYGFASGLRSLTCYAGEESAGRKSWDDGDRCVLSGSMEFQIDRSSVQGSPVMITVHAADRAGNTAVKTEKIYIDRAAPVLEVSGIHDRMITAGQAAALITAEDENLLELCTVTVMHTNVNGETSEYIQNSEVVWKKSGGGQLAEVKFTEDGIYECVFAAADAAGHRTEKKITFTIDSRSPVIRYVGQQNGAYIPFFQWNYSIEEMIGDFTEYTCRMTLDGRIYLSGTRITEEGKHLLEVQAEDAAGNTSSSMAIFTIDNTPPKIQYSGAAEGETYEEKVELNVWVDGERERLTGLVIDGSAQRLSPDSRIFQTEIRGYGSHLVEVQAEDDAGNRTEEQIRFEITKKQSFISGIIHTENGSGSDASGKNAEEKTGNDRTDESAVPVGKTALILCCTAAAAAGGAAVRRRKKKKTP
ncbi:MAG TPA: hypothetical protein H9955_06940 [Candidatus Mediterraneibacter cottocaccae]|nr:hypothetical protein [Candidatus Mediterraneibacter cottocaccae]